MSVWKQVPGLRRHSDPSLFTEQEDGLGGLDGCEGGETGDAKAETSGSLKQGGDVAGARPSYPCRALGGHDLCLGDHHVV